MYSSLIRIRQNSERCSLFLFTLICVVGVTACAEQIPTRQQLLFTGPIMGTDYRITVIADKAVDREQLESGIVDAMNSVNESMSNYLADSEISKFNRLPENQLQKLSTDFAEVIKESLHISALSNGAFDITLARAIDVWGFGPHGQITHRPSTDELESLKISSGFKKLVFEDGSLMKTARGVEISLSAIAKGYAVDKVAHAIESQGFSDYLINIGGELRASGLSTDKQYWRVGIEKPHILGGIQQIVKLDNASIATSGDYRNYLVVDGRQFSHMIDPKTLTPVYHKLALVSVISEKASTADALATAMMAMDEQKALAFANKNKIAAYLIIRGEREGELMVQITEKFRPYLQ